MRELNDLERKNIALLTTNDVPYGVLEVTETGLVKSILDATEPFREFLQEYAIHDFARQLQGPDSKNLLLADLVTTDGRLVPSRASLYRPLSKQGDPRVWFRDLGKVISPSQVLAAVWSGNQFWVFNASAIDVATALQASGPLRDLLAPYVKEKLGAVESLLGMLRGVASKGYLPAPVKGATAVGRLLESELGIGINSSPDPDFRGIEIKSSRKSTNRTTLFAKTPDWSASRYRSSRELLDAFGYDRSGRRKLSCTISGIVTNSQGLSLRVDDRADLLHVMHGTDERQSAVRWDLDVLRHSLAKKHNETFWVKADTKIIDGWEYIRFNAVQHTQKPMTTQLSGLLDDGKVTVDFLIREEGDKGYLFKILPKNLPFLFPPAESYELSPGTSIAGPPPEAPTTIF